MVDKPLPGCAEGCVLLLLDDSVDGIFGQVCCYDFKVNLFSILLIWSVAAPLRSSAMKEDGVVGIVQGRVLGLEVRDGLGKLSYFDSI